MTGLIKSILPVLFLTGVFVGGVYLLKYIIHRLVDHK